MTKKEDTAIVSENIIETSFKKALSERYLAYALSTIMDRSLPDVRDGLKPVHRRLLYAMHELGLSPQKGYKKAARVVGDVIGKFHPHGEGSIYDALVRMAQDFACRYPLVDGQGNFGNIDGDNAAAMRYTEARLTDVAQAMLEGIEEETVLLKPTYDGTLEEPSLLPARFPNLLANGAMGIAVGMATNIPPHNVGEICKALLYLMDHKDAKTEELLEFIKGPDFPTGGILIEEKDAFLKAYETGRGKFRLRASWTKENVPGGGYVAVVTQIPYHVQKNKLIEKMADLLEIKKLPFLADLRDESASDIRLVLIPKSRDLDPIFFMESLFRETDLEVRISLNMNVLDADCVPRVMSLREVLDSFLAHRLNILLSQGSYRLRVVKNRLEILRGFLIAFLNLDEIIQIIREEDDPKSTMILRFNLSEIQAEAILNMRLRSLRKLEEIEIKKETQKLEEEEKELEDLLAHEKVQKKALKEDILWIEKKFGSQTSLGARRTCFEALPQGLDMDIESFIEKEPLTLCCSQNGWIRSINGHLTPEDIQKIKYKEGDKEGYILKVMSTDKLLIGTTTGRFYTLSIDKLPRGRGYGEPLQLLIDLEPNSEVLGLYPYGSDHPMTDFLMLATDGRGFRTKVENLLAQTKVGKQILTCPENVKAFGFFPFSDLESTVALLGSNKRLLLLKMKDVAELSKGRGSMLQKYRGAQLTEAIMMSSLQTLVWKRVKGKEVPLENQHYWIGKCGDVGRLLPVEFQGDGYLAVESVKKKS
ncbi:MAG: DNA topoisomerase IV subunit A [Proteobacteria bacterium]|nr:DNA topoisomerase IV subunit A [Pseudomonadota bacterium]